MPNSSKARSFRHHALSDRRRLAHSQPGQESLSAESQGSLPLIYKPEESTNRNPFVAVSQNSQSAPLRAAYGYAIRLALPLIWAIIRIRCFSDITLRVTRMMRERGLLLSVTLLLLCLRNRHRPRHRWWWRLRQQKQLWCRRRAKAETLEGQGYDEDTQPRETETIVKGVLTSRSIDFVFCPNN